MPKAIDAFAASQAANGLTVVAAIATPTLVIDSTNYFRMPNGSKVGTITGRGANLARMQVLRSGDQIPLIDSANVAALAADHIIDEYNQVPFVFNKDEKLSCYVDNSNNNEPQGVVFTHGYILHILAPNVVTRIIRITSTTAAVARAWTALTSSWVANLPASGKFKILGMRVASASGHAARLILSNGDRPGVPTQHASPAQMLYFSEPFEGDFAQLPTIEILSSTTTNAHTIELAIEYAQ